MRDGALPPIAHRELDGPDAGVSLTLSSLLLEKNMTPLVPRSSRCIR
jgi:hypothetical protein